MLSYQMYLSNTTLNNLCKLRYIILFYFFLKKRKINIVTRSTDITIYHNQRDFDTNINI